MPYYLSRQDRTFHRLLNLKSSSVHCGSLQRHLPLRRQRLACLTATVNVLPMLSLLSVCRHNGHVPLRGRIGHILSVHSCERCHGVQSGFSASGYVVDGDTP